MSRGNLHPAGHNGFAVDEAGRREMIMSKPFTLATQQGPAGLYQRQAWHAPIDLPPKLDLLPRRRASGTNSRQPTTSFRPFLAL